jgi:hypothetical protein
MKDINRTNIIGKSHLLMNLLRLNYTDDSLQESPHSLESQGIPLVREVHPSDNSSIELHAEVA